MKTPFTLFFDRAEPPLVLASPNPFVPAYALPFVQAACSLHARAGDGWITYRWHDAYDVFVAVLEASLPHPVALPIQSHLADLYLVYQLQGKSHFVPDALQHPRTPSVALLEGHRMEVYTPPAQAVLELHPCRHSNRYTAVAIVPKSGWVTRHPTSDDSPMENLIRILKDEYDAHHYLHPSPISPGMYTWLHILLTTPAYAGMRLDDALNRPMVRLMEKHREGHRWQVREDKQIDFIDAACMLVREIVHHMEDGVPPTAEVVAHALQTTPGRIQSTHALIYKQRFDHFVFACRIAEAKERLISDLPISAIAYQLGWNDPANFSHDFKRHTGTTPTEFRRRYNLGEA